MLNSGIEFDRDRAFYIGLNKIKDRHVRGHHKIVDDSSTYTATAKAAASVGPVGLLTGVRASASASGTRESLEVTDLSARSQLLAIAPAVLGDVLRVAEPALSDSAFEVGRTYHYTGPARFRIRTHDDFRAEGDQNTAPRLSLWLIELPWGQEPESADSVTWIVLSGTTQGQLVTEMGGTIGDWRGGSQTEQLFELMDAKSRGEAPQRTDGRWLRHPWLVASARNLLNDSQKQTIELAFECLEVNDCPTSGDDSEVSHLGWSPASTDREVPVSRVILGTPFFVQMTPAAAQILPAQKMTLWQRLKRILGR